MTRLSTERLILRPVTLADVDALHAVFSDPRAMRYWSTLPHESVEQTRKLVAGMSAADPAKHLELAIELRGHVIGKMGLWDMPEIGYILHPDHWGQGYATEAARAVIQHAFDALGLDQITADVDPDNAVSLKMLGKLGFQETGREKNTIQIGGKWFDSVYLALTPEGFTAHQG